MAASAHTPPEGPPEGQGPLGIGAYHVPAPDELVHTWHDICRIAAVGDLADYYRHEVCEQQYKTWRGPIRERYGSIEEYIRQVRLQWGSEAGASVGEHSPLPGQSAPRPQTHGHEYFRPEWGPDRVKCIPNDWPYGIPVECGHFVVWSKSPMLHPLLFQTPDTPFEPDQRTAIYQAVVQDGVRGLTGGHAHTPPVVGLKTIELLREETGVSDDDIGVAAARAHAWAGRYVNAYVEARWPPEEWETAWFCNPPHLRTVPDLDHFHVIVRRKQSGAIAHREL
ncbi:unnamed protein product [Parajaminaea phylloscopi]